MTPRLLTGAVWGRKVLWGTNRPRGTLRIERIKAPLRLDLIPKTSFGRNVRDVLSPQAWRRLSGQVAQQAGHTCEICGGRGARHPVECHEVFSYSYATLVQRLDRLVALCPACHAAKHFGRTFAVGDPEAAIRHIEAVNRWTYDRVVRHIEASLRLWEYRSAITWDIDLSALTQYPLLSAATAPVDRTDARPCLL